jgi:hypothetical protein
MLKDKGLLILFTVVSMGFGFAILLNGVAYWWVFWFSMLFFYGHLVTLLVKVNDEKEWNRIVKKNGKTWPKIFIDDESEYWPDDWEDYKAQYIPPEEYNVPDNCNECGYAVCVCKPVVNKQKTKNQKCCGRNVCNHKIA